MTREGDIVPDGRSAWFVAIFVVVLGSIGLGAAGLTALRGEVPPWMATGTPTPVATTLATPPPIRTTTPLPTQPPTPSPTATAVAALEEVQYIVVAGDGLERIAAEFGVTPEAVAERNNLVPPYRLEVGQVLLIPDAE